MHFFENISGISEIIAIYHLQYVSIVLVRHHFAFALIAVIETCFWLCYCAFDRFELLSLTLLTYFHFFG